MLTAEARRIVFAVKLTPEKVKIWAKNVKEEITLTTTFNGTRDVAKYRLQLLQRYHANGLKDKCHLLSEFIATKIETWEEPMKVMRGGDRIAKELP